MNKKRHHYVPRAYLRPFCDGQGRLRVYRKDEPEKIICQSPDNFGFHKYYYSQPSEDGGRDNCLEDLFSKLESKWPPLVDGLRRGDDIGDSESLGVLLDFIALQRARVPAARDMIERIRAEQVMSTTRVMDASGLLPPKPPGHGDILDHLEVAIDPHQSLLEMKPLMDGIDRVFSEIGLGALHNKTDIPLLTSDNPVIWFDPSVPETEMRPYVWRPGTPLVFIFPVAPDCVIYGHSSMREQFAIHGFGYGDLSSSESVEMMNRQICRFAYEAVFAQKSGQEALICEHAGVSPVLQTSRLPGAQGEVLLFSNVFGPRTRKPKWAD
ncbi:MAG: DUF4238 domain-containing protein [Alphaproteobacteria bacterium]|nr:DUF4238 domain-containing protein [Alphaproteobacteria bacterium]